MSTTNGRESLLRKAGWFGAWLLTLAIAFGAGTWTGYEMPRSGVDPQDYIESVFTPYEDGLQHYLEFLDRAHNSVNIAAYSFTHPEIVDKLIELKMTRGVIVRVLLDLSQSHNKSEKAQIERLRQAGIEVVIGKSESHGQIMHHKYTVVDEIWVHSGSWNFSKSANHQANELDFVRSKKRARVFLANWHRMYRFMKANAGP